MQESTLFLFPCCNPAIKFLYFLGAITSSSGLIIADKS